MKWNYERQNMKQSHGQLHNEIKSCKDKIKVGKNT